LHSVNNKQQNVFAFFTIKEKTCLVFGLYWNTKWLKFKLKLRPPTIQGIQFSVAGNSKAPRFLFLFALFNKQRKIFCPFARFLITTELKTFLALQRGRK